MYVPGAAGAATRTFTVRSSFGVMPERLVRTPSQTIAFPAASSQWYERFTSLPQVKFERFCTFTG